MQRKRRVPPVEIIAHLADVEIVGSWRVRLILARDGVPVQTFHQDGEPRFTALFAPTSPTSTSA